MRLTKVRSWKMATYDMCPTSAGHIAVKPQGKGEIQMCNRKGQTLATYNLCDKQANYTNFDTMCRYYECIDHAFGKCGKYITELIAGQYLAHLCDGCNEILVVAMRTGNVHRPYSGTDCRLQAMCSGPSEGSLLAWDDRGKAVLHLQWNASSKELDEIRRVQVPGGGGNATHVLRCPGRLGYSEPW